ncbi:MAG TPA: Ig-like domain repeat protein [Afipia sp.]
MPPLVWVLASGHTEFHDGMAGDSRNVFVIGALMTGNGPGAASGSFHNFFLCGYRLSSYPAGTKFDGVQSGLIFSRAPQKAMPRLFFLRSIKRCCLLSLAALLFLVAGNVQAALAAVPDAPTNVSASTTPDQNGATISFTPPVNDGGSQIIDYTVTANPGNLTATGTLSPINLTGLTNGITYTFTVTAINASGTSLPSAASNAVTPLRTQTITFGNPGSQNYGTTLALNAASSSGLPLDLVSTTPSICDFISAGQLKMEAPGSCTVTASQSGGSGFLPAASVQQTFAVVVPAGAVSIITTTLPVPIRGVAYSQAITAAGGAPPYTFQISGSLPDGLIFSAAGVLSGVPRSSGTFFFSVQVTDAAGSSAIQNYSFTVSSSTFVTSPATLPSGGVGVPYPSVQLSTLGGIAPYTYALTSGGLPGGLTLSAGGILSGTPTTAGNFPITVTATDNFGATGAQAYVISIGGTTRTVLVSSLNPSGVGQAVTFTATVSGAGGVPTGSVTFKDGTNVIGAAALSGGAGTVTVSSLSVGTHDITADYGGSATFAVSTSAVLRQSVGVATDSAKLRSLQVEVTKVVAQGSGQAISGAVDDAISEGFNNGSNALVTPGPNGIRFNFSAEPDGDSDATNKQPLSRSDSYSVNSFSQDGRSSGGRTRNNSLIDEAFNAIDRQAATKAPPKKFREEKNWLFWADVRGTGIDRWSTPTVPGGGSTQNTLSGFQVNALMGLTYKVAPTFLVGVLGGYETFNYTEQNINGKLTGDGWTIGSYIGWKITPTLRYDAAVAYSDIGYDGVAGTAKGNFSGQRWLVSTGLTGTYKAAGFLLEPSAKVYALWENEGAYTDTLGTPQASYNFATGRASAGVKLAYPIAPGQTVDLLPYVGIYGDYYFNHDDAGAFTASSTLPLASSVLLDGYSARVTGGLDAKFASGGTIGVGAEYGGLGNDFQIWTVRARANVPF